MLCFEGKSRRPQKEEIIYQLVLGKTVTYFRYIH